MAFPVEPVLGSADPALGLRLVTVYPQPIRPQMWVLVSADNGTQSITRPHRRLRGFRGDSRVFGGA